MTDQVSMDLGVGGMGWWAAGAAAVLLVGVATPAEAATPDIEPAVELRSAHSEAPVVDDSGSGGFVVIGGADGSVAVVPDADPADLAIIPGLSLLEVRDEQTVVAFGGGDDGVGPAGAASDPWREDQWNLDLYDMEELWSAASTDGAGIVVAIIDTGVDASHPDLVGRVGAGWDFITDQPTAAGASIDTCGHGTHVAGTLAAVANNGIGATGVAPGVTIMPVRVLGGSACSGSMSDVESAIIWAAGNGADVINLSLGAPAGGLGGASNAAVNYAMAQGTVVVASAGNCGYHRTWSKCTTMKEGDAAIPAAYQGVLSVANVDPHLVASETSNRDPFVDVAAPGIVIAGPWLAGGTARLSGTSMASPHIAGLVALALAADPSLPADSGRTPAIESRVFGGAIDLGVTGRDDTYGMGLADPWPLVLPALPAPAVTVTDTTVSWTPVSGATGYELTVLDELTSSYAGSSSAATVAGGTTSLTRPSPWAVGRFVFKVRALGVAAAPGIGVEPFPSQSLEVLPVDGGALVKLAPITYGYQRAWPTDTLDDSGATWIEDVHGDPMGLLFNGLTNGVTRSFRSTEVHQGWTWWSTAPTLGPVAASPAAGLGASGPVAGVIAQPVADDELSLSWLPPDDVNGYPVTGYRVTHNRMATGETVVVSPSSPAVTLGPTHMSSGLTHVVTIQPWTAVGGGQPVSVSVTMPGPVSSEPVGGSPSTPVFSPGVVGPEGPVIIDTTSGQALAVSTSAPEPSRLVAVHRKGDGSTWAIDPEGRMYTTGTAAHRGDLGALALNEPVLGMTPTADGSGYWMVASDGGVFAFDVPFFGSMGGTPLNREITGMAVTPTGLGYHLVASDGGVFSFGDARFHGSLGGVVLNRPINGMAVTPSGNGYWMVASDGGVFSFGDAAFHGSLGDVRLGAPVIGLISTESGQGYWLIDAVGRSYPFGDAR
ncbi:MAG: S8 family serine peptidase [Actinomycetia bacterium]|nr:S8 family serine peptidase [Actinomycetes bacterium]